VSSNTLALHHDPDNFTLPMEFVPERWNDETRDATWKHDVRAWMPFTGGTFSCAGRALALVELRLFVTRVVKTLDLTMAADFDHDEWARHVKSYQSLVMGPLRLTVRRRE
jgi:cytochrome P450